MKRLFYYFLLSLVLLLVGMSSALLAMRVAIHGRELRVPKLQGLALAEAERLASADGLVLSVESRFYSPEVPEGHIVSQLPGAGSKVRRGLRIRIAESLGPQRASIPDLTGQSQHAANINVSRRGLEISTTGTMHYPGVQPGMIVTQSPPPNTTNISSPRISLIFAPADNTQWYIMPKLVGRSLAEIRTELSEAGLSLGPVGGIPVSGSGIPIASGIILHQYPLAGQRVSASSVVSLEVAR